MNSRERLRTALGHKELDRVPIDFAGTDVSGICYQAYNDLRAHLGMASHEFRLEDLGAGAWAGVVTPHADMYGYLCSDVMAVNLGSPTLGN